MPHKRGRIGILYPVGYLDSVPCVRNTIVMLSKHGFLVEVFILDSGAQYYNVHFSEPNIILHSLRLEARWRIVGCMPNILRFTSWVLNLCRRKKFTCFIGIDPPGLLAATALGMLCRTPWVYFSLELIVSTDTVPMYQKYKQFEIWSSRRSSFIIIQDEIRARLMAKENDIQLSQFVYLPNSPLGEASRCRTDYLHKQFGFTAEHKIILHAGSMADWTLSRELAIVAQKFPEQWKLVFQTRGNFRDTHNYLSPSLIGNRVFVSDQAVPSPMLNELMNSADIGIAVYNALGSANITFMGKSSGKLCQYLYCGLPIIATRLPGWEENLQNYCSGISIGSLNEITTAIEQIFADYDRFSEGALNHFKNELRFEPAFAEVMSRLIMLT